MGCNSIERNLDGGKGVGVRKGENTEGIYVGKTMGQEGG